MVNILHWYHRQFTGFWGTCCLLLQGKTFMLNMEAAEMLLTASASRQCDKHSRWQAINLKLQYTFRYRHTGGGCKSLITKDFVPMSEATTSLWPSVSSPWHHMSMDSDTRSEQAGIMRSVRRIGLPKSRTTNLLAPECILSMTSICWEGITNSRCQGNSRDPTSSPYETQITALHLHITQSQASTAAAMAGR